MHKSIEQFFEVRIKEDRAMTFSSRFNRSSHLAIVIFLISFSCAQAASLRPETVQAWEEYIQEANTRVQQRLTPGSSFLWMDEAEERGAKARNKQIVVSPVGPHIPRKIPSGLIHDWIAVAFMPKLTISDVLPVIRDYDRYKEFYHPNVIDSKTIELHDSRDRFSTVLINKVFFKKTALDSDYEASYFRVDARRLYTISQSTRIQEIAEYGATGEHALPENEGTGLIWRLYTVIRFEERDGGLYTEVEAIALSRDIPRAMAAIANPIVRRVSRDSLFTALKQTEAAVRLKATL